MSSTGSLPSAAIWQNQGIAQRVPGYDGEVPGVTAVDLDVRRIRRKPVLNGLINQYSRAA